MVEDECKTEIISHPLKKVLEKCVRVGGPWTRSRYTRCYCLIFFCLHIYSSCYIILGTYFGMHKYTVSKWFVRFHYQFLCCFFFLILYIIFIYFASYMYGSITFSSHVVPAPAHDASFFCHLSMVVFTFNSFQSIFTYGLLIQLFFTTLFLQYLTCLFTDSPRVWFEITSQYVLKLKYRSVLQDQIIFCRIF